MNMMKRLFMDKRLLILLATVVILVVVIIPAVSTLLPFLHKKGAEIFLTSSLVVKIGIDASLVNIEINGTQVSITLSPAKVLGCTVDDQNPRFIVDANSAKITAKDEVAAWNESKKKMEETATNDTALPASAQQRAQALLEGYITSVGEATGKEYTIKWLYPDGDNTQSTTSTLQTTTIP